MLLFDTLADLWRLLDRRGRWIASVLVFLLALSGALELFGIIFLFGYIASISGLGGAAGNLAARFYQGVAGDLDGAAFAAAAGVALLAIFAVKNIAGLLTSFFLMRFAMKRCQQIATHLFKGFLHARLEVFQRRGTQTAQQMVDSVMNVFRSSFNPALEALSNIAIVAAMLTALLFVLDPWLVIVAGALLGTGGVGFLAVTRQVSAELGRRRLAADRALRRTMLDAFRGLIDLRLGGRVEATVARYRRLAGEFALADRRAQALDKVPRALNEMLLAVGIVFAAIWFSGAGGVQQALPALAVLGFAGLRITAAMSRLSSALQRIRQGEPARQRLMATVRDTAPALLAGNGAPASEDYLAADQPLPPGRSGRLTDRITLDGVTFTYPGAEEAAVRDVSLEIERGSFVGLCGPSGGGKSTLALVIMGLLRPQQGRVLCDGWDIFRHLRAWHANIGYVGQAPFITSGSVRDNVAFGCEPGEIDDARVWRALETASVAAVIRARPQGLDAAIGEEGVLLSGGQRQRLVIARALYRDPAVLVFDEATAALDNVTEQEVSEAIAAMSGASTVICIAHRLSTIRDADVIHYVEEGRILASGRYVELERASPGFRRMAMAIGNAA